MSTSNEAARPYRKLLATLFDEAVRAVGGRQALYANSVVEADRWLYRRGGQEVCVQLPQRSGTGKVFVLGAGKAAASLAHGLEQVLGDRIDAGLVIVKRGHREDLQRVGIVEASHPTPDLSSVQATQQLLALLRTTSDADTIFFVLSGGASSLLFAPAADLSYQAKAAAVQLLVNSGAPIEEINVVRRHLSAVKGGRLRLQARCAQFCTLAISDVISDDPATIGSGPTVADASTFGDALDVVERHELRGKLPAAVIACLQRGAQGLEEETPERGDATFKDDVYQIVASNRVSLATCMDAARKLGYPAEIVSENMAGNTHAAARSFASTLAAAARSPQNSGSPRLFFAGGETTLSVSQGGKGGRNQEFALVAASELQDIPNVVLLSAGTDGTDGPTDAAGAFADGATIERARALGFDPQEHLRRHDVYPLLEALGDLHRTGPTGTNVMDLVIGVAF